MKEIGCNRKGAREKGGEDAREMLHSRKGAKERMQGQGYQGTNAREGVQDKG